MMNYDIETLALILLPIIMILSFANFIYQLFMNALSACIQNISKWEKHKHKLYIALSLITLCGSYILFVIITNN